MKVTTVWNGKRSFTAKGASEFPVQMDASRENGGDGNGATPMELLLAGLTGCMGIDLTIILKPYTNAITRLELEASGTRAQAVPAGFSSIELTVNVDGDVAADRIWRAIRLAKEKYCPVSASLNAELHFRLILNGEEAVEV